MTPRIFTYFILRRPFFILWTPRTGCVIYVYSSLEIAHHKYYQFAGHPETNSFEGQNEAVVVIPRSACPFP